MKTTAYFDRRVAGERPYLQFEWMAETVAAPAHEETQPDGRVRFWRFLPDLGKYLRVVTLEDRDTLHNAFPDRSFRLPDPPP